MQTMSKNPRAARRVSKMCFSDLVIAHGANAHTQTVRAIELRNPFQLIITHGSGSRVHLALFGCVHIHIDIKVCGHRWKHARGGRVNLCCVVVVHYLYINWAMFIKINYYTGGGCGGGGGRRRSTLSALHCIKCDGRR